MTKTKTYTGGCHCGEVRYEVEAPLGKEVLACNCSICEMVGFLHFIVEKDAFRITAGEDNLTDYRFNTGTARHLFCKICGVKPCYVPRSHPDGWSVNARTLDDNALSGMTIKPFDGANWEANVAKIQ